MTAYRFCRTDDMGRLVEAHNHCRLPHHPGEPPLTLAEFKGLVRDRQLWCSSCLIAYEGEEPVGYLFGCKRARETLLQSFAVHPAHLRRGHGRHLLTSISSKLAILGPPRLVVEAPAEAEAALALLQACGYEQEQTLTDWVRFPGPAPAPDASPGDLFIPVTAADLLANGSLGEGSPGPAWERATPTLLALGDRLSGTALVRDERLLGAILYIWEPDGGAEGRILLLQGSGPDAGPVMDRLLGRLLAGHPGRWLFPRARPDEPAAASLRGLGFQPAGRFLRMTAVARPA
jgi:ribosomal protein S18 acetylase RimI-like enzyme